MSSDFSKMEVKRLIQELVCDIEIECGNTLRGWGESSLLGKPAPLAVLLGTER